MAINEKWVEKVRKELAELAKGSGKNALYEADMVIETLLQENARIKEEYSSYKAKVAHSEISAKEWRNRVTAKLMKTDPNIEEDDLFFSATTSGYRLAYEPYYPEKSSADINIYGSFRGEIRIHGIIQSSMHTVEQCISIEEFENMFEYTIPKIEKIKPLKNFKLYVVFTDGKKGFYNVSEVIDHIPQFKDLKIINGLFEQVQLDKSKTCVYWTDLINLTSDEIYENLSIDSK